MFAVLNINNRKNAVTEACIQSMGCGPYFLPVAVNVEYNTVSVYPRAERQCARSILLIVLSSGTGTGTFLLILVCLTNQKTSRPPLSSATVRRPVAATWPPLPFINTLLITFPRTIRVPELSQSPFPMPMTGKVLGRSREGNSQFHPLALSVPPCGTASARHPHWRWGAFAPMVPKPGTRRASRRNWRWQPSEPTVPCQYTCCATIPTPGSPSEASVCTASASASCPLPGATACSIPAPSISTASSTPWAHRPSMGFTTRPWPSAAVTCRASGAASSVRGSVAPCATSSDIPVQSCPCGSQHQRIDCNFVFICFIWLVGAPSSPWRQLSDPAASTMRRVAVRVSLTNYQPGLIK